MKIEEILRKENVGKEFYFQGHVYMVFDVPCGPYGRETKYILQEKFGKRVEENHDLISVVNGDFEMLR
jgi:hypothetical protein